MVASLKRRLMRTVVQAPPPLVLAALYAALIPPFGRDTQGRWIGGQFHDGRAATLEDQAAGPPLNPIEITAELDMGMPLARVDSAYHDIALSRRAGVYSLALVNGVSEMDRDFVLSWQPVGGSAQLTTGWVIGGAIKDRRATGDVASQELLGGLEGAVTSLALLGEQHPLSVGLSSVVIAVDHLGAAVKLGEGVPGVVGGGVCPEHSVLGIL